MKERNFDEMIAYFNRRVSEMDIAQNYKIELLGMVTALGYKHEKTAQHWIPCSERLPEEPFGCIVAVWDTNPITMDEFENILPYFVGWDGEQWNDGDGEQCPFEVIAWMPLPEPYKAERREE